MITHALCAVYRNVLVLKREFVSARIGIAGQHKLRSVAALLGSNLTATLLSALGGLMVARFLGPEETGAFRLYTIPLGYLVFLHLGTWDGLWRQIPYYVGKGMPEKVESAAAVAGAFNLLVSGLVSLGFLCCALRSLLRGDSQGVLGWLSQAVFCWGVFYGGYLSSTYRTLNQFVVLARYQALQALCTFAMVFLLPWLRFYGLCARAALPAVLGLWLFHRQRPVKVRYRLCGKELKELLNMGLPFCLWGNLETSVWIATESALVLSLGGVSALGLFSVATVMRGAVNSLPLSIWQVLTPGVVSELARDGSVTRANGRSVRITAALTGFMVLFALAGSFLLEFLVPLLIPKYQAGIPIMKLCLWFPVLQAAFLPLNLLFATGRPWLFNRSVLVGMAVFPLATCLLLPVTGGPVAVVAGSLLGRAARLLAAYLDLAALTRAEG